MTDIMAVESIRLVVSHLNRVLEEPQNMTFRKKLSYASLLAGIVIGQTDLGLVHRMGYPLTLEMGMAHGKANGLLLPWVCEFILNKARHKSATIAEGLEVEIEEPKDQKVIEKIVQKIQVFLSQIGLESGIESRDLIEEKIHLFSERTPTDFESEGNFLQETIRENMENIALL